MNTGRALASLLTGTLFGLGLAVSQMTDPEKVLSFLRIVPGWDPSLLLVMVAAIPVTFVGYRWAIGAAPWFDHDHRLPTLRAITGKLILGAVIFGVGWGLAGFCPGPAIAGLTSGMLEPVVFIGAMLVGSQLARIVTK